MLVAAATSATATVSNFTSAQFFKVHAARQCYKSSLRGVGARRRTLVCRLLMLVLFAHPVITRPVDDSKMRTTTTNGHYHGDLSDHGDVDQLRGTPHAY